MKKWRKQIAFCAAYISSCAFSYYDTNNKFWFAPLLVWIFGAYWILKDLKPDIYKEIESLKNSTNNNDFICAFISSSISFAVLITLFAMGFTGSFRFELGSYGDSFIESILNGLFSLFGFSMILFFLWLVFSVVVGSLLSSLFSEEHAMFGAKILLRVLEFLLISYICGVIDMARIIRSVSSVLDFVNS